MNNINILSYLPIELWLKINECTGYDLALKKTCKFFSQPDFLAQEADFFATLWRSYNGSMLALRMVVVNKNSSSSTTPKEKVKALYQGIMKEAEQHKVSTKTELSIRIYTLSAARLKQIDGCITQKKFAPESRSPAPNVRIIQVSSVGLNPNWQEEAQSHLNQIKSQSNGQ